MFGHPIHLKYQGNPEYRSVFGGIVTIFTMIVLFLFTGLLLYRVATNEALSISNFTELKSQALDGEHYIQLNISNFDIAFFYAYIGKNKPKDIIDDNYDEYFQSSLKVINYTIVTDVEQQKTDGLYKWEYGRQKVVRCDNSRFMNMTDITKKLGITGIYWCPEKNFSYTLSGSYSSSFAKFLTFEFDYCSQDWLDWKYPGQNKKCKPLKEAESLIADI